jgi:hypothetical protein
LAVAAVVPAYRGAIRGTVDARGPLPPTEKAQVYGPRCAQAELAALPAGPLANAFVKLNGGLPPLPPAPSAPVVLEHKGCTFLPRVTMVRSEQPLELRNNDVVAHRVRGSLPGTSVFSVQLAPHQRSTQVIAGSGALTLTCDSGPAPCGLVYVSDRPFAALTDASGRFAIEGFPPGRYTLSVEHERAAVESRSILVTAAPHADVNLSVAARRSGYGDCKLAIKDASPVSWACAEGGIRKAKLVMKDMLKRGKESGLKFDCDDCHAEDSDYSRLTTDAPELFKKLLAAFEKR